MRFITCPLLGLALLTLALFAGGCASISTFYNNLMGNDQTQQVTPDQFVNRRVTNESPLSAVDRGGQLSPDNPRLTSSQESPPAANGRPATPRPGPAPGEVGISNVVKQAIRPPGQDATITGAGPTTNVSTTTQPATEPTEATALAGNYLTLGGVLSEVNGTPIFANKVLQLLGPTLRNLARETDADHFSVVARDKIERQIGELERNELDFAAAEQNLESSDKNLVDALTATYRRKLVTDAGGSEQVARRRAAANGDDFDDLVLSQYRLYMIQLYYQKRFTPRLQVGAADMRRYYEQHRAKDFTQTSEASFDLLKIDPALYQGASAAADHKLAFDKAKEAHDRAVHGAAFATLFKEYNNDPGMVALTNGTGNMGKIQKGAFSIPEVEDAVWNLQPGQVSDVINVKGVLYLAKMETRKDGKVQSFEDEGVQDEIAFKLRTEQLQELRGQEQTKLLDKAIVRTDPQMIDTAVDMAMQNYRIWTKK